MDSIIDHGDDPWERIEKLVLTINKSKQISSQRLDHNFDNSFEKDLFGLQNVSNIDDDDPSIDCDEVNVISAEDWEKNKMMKNNRDENVPGDTSNSTNTKPVQSPKTAESTEPQEEAGAKIKTADNLAKGLASKEVTKSIPETIVIVTESNTNLPRPASEKRLFEELKRLNSPVRSGKELMQNILHVARTFSDNSSYEEETTQNRKSAHLYISCLRLADVLVSMGVHMTDSEIEQLSAGLCSNDAGCVSATELCELIDELLYRVAREQLAGVRDHMSEPTKGFLHSSTSNMHQLGTQLCREFMATHLADIKSAAQTSSISALGVQLVQVQKLLVRPFLAHDIRRTGLIGADKFHAVVTEMFPMATRDRPESISVIANQYSVQPHSVDTQLPTIVKYRPFLKSLVKLISHFLTDDASPSENKSTEKAHFDLVHSSRALPTMDDFPTIHRVLIQLEAMSAAQRRRCLTKLHLKLSDPLFSVAGAKLVQLLTDAGLSLGHEDTRFLSNRSATENSAMVLALLRAGVGIWGQEERAISSKILKAMGATLPHRRRWLTLLQRDLESCRDVDTDHAPESIQGSHVDKPHHRVTHAVTPAQFLSCLRKRDVSLTLAQEATLIDCLDLESAVHSHLDTGTSTSDGSDTSGFRAKLPKINYQLFLQFCDRHCGYENKDYPDLHPSVEYSALLSRIADFLTAADTFTDGPPSLHQGENKELISSPRRVKVHTSLNGRVGSKKSSGRERLTKLLARLALYANCARTTRSMTGCSHFHVPRKELQSVLATCGLLLTEEEITVLVTNSTAHRDSQSPRDVVSTVALTDALRVSELTHMGVRASGQSSSDVAKKEWDSKTDGKAVVNARASRHSDALELVRQSLQIERGRWGRTVAEWRADLTTLFQGYTAFETELISCEEFIDCLSILNVSITAKTADELAVENCRNMIAYKAILSKLFQSMSPHADCSRARSTMSPRHSSKGRRSAGAEHSSLASLKYVDLVRRSDSRVTSTHDTASLHPSVAQLIGEVAHFLNHRYPIESVSSTRQATPTRPGKSSSDERINEVWAALVTTFARYDPNGRELVSERDFYLAASLLIDSVELSFSDDDWGKVSVYYATSKTRYQTDKMPQAIEYPTFCFHVMACFCKLQPITAEKDTSVASQKIQDHHRHDEIKAVSRNKPVARSSSRALIKTSAPLSTYRKLSVDSPTRAQFPDKSPDEESKVAETTVFRFKGLLNTEHIRLRPKRTASSMSIAGTAVRDRRHEADTPPQSIPEPRIRSSGASSLHRDERRLALALVKAATSARASGSGCDQTSLKLHPRRLYTTPTPNRSTESGRNETPTRALVSCMTKKTKPSVSSSGLVKVVSAMKQSSPTAATPNHRQTQSQSSSRKLKSEKANTGKVAELDYYDTKKPFISRKELNHALKSMLTHAHATATARSATRIDCIRTNQLQEFVLKAYNDDELKVLQEVRYEILQHLNHAMKKRCTESDKFAYDNILDFFLDAIDDFMARKSDGRIPSDFITCKDLFCLLQKEFFINTKRMFETETRQRILDTLESMGRKSSGKDILEIHMTDFINLVFSHSLNGL